MLTSTSHSSVVVAPKPGRRRTSVIVRATTIGLFVGLLPTVAGATPAQSVGSLRDKAAKIAAELEDLDRATNALDEDYNNATLELDGLRKKLAANQAQVDQARSSLEANRNQAQDFAVQAYVGRGDDSSVLGVSDDSSDASHRKTFLAARYGNSEDVIDGLVASQKDLADQEAALESANAAVDAKVTEITSAKESLQAKIDQREALYASVKGELADALAAEQARLAREAAAKAEAEARAAAARAAAARRPQAVAVRAPSGNVGAAGRTAVAPAVAPAASSTQRAVTPPPANSPKAVEVALAQQGDPYRWAASGPDSFDCSGLVMYAYAAAGISLPHSSRSLRSMTRSISVDELQPGDLVFGGSPVHHVGIYIGDGQMVHAPHSGDVVKVSGIYSTSKPVSFGRL